MSHVYRARHAATVDISTSVGDPFRVDLFYDAGNAMRTLIEVAEIAEIAENAMINKFDSHEDTAISF